MLLQSLALVAAISTAGVVGDDATGVGLGVGVVLALGAALVTLGSALDVVVWFDDVTTGLWSS